MARRRKKNDLKTIQLSFGPLPQKLATHYAGQRMVFCDASLKSHGGLAAVLFADEFSEPLTFSRTVPPSGSNALELAAALFALGESCREFPDQPVTLFSDNLVAVTRLTKALAEGLSGDPELAILLANYAIYSLPVATRYQWIPGHATCRGNALADELAGLAATRRPCSIAKQSQVMLPNTSSQLQLVQKS